MIGDEEDLHNGLNYFKTNIELWVFPFRKSCYNLRDWGQYLSLKFQWSGSNKRSIGRMKRVRTNSILWFILTCLINVPNLEGALPFGIFPILTTGWYYKPGPIESVVLGLIIVKVSFCYNFKSNFAFFRLNLHKVLAIRLGATLAGVPYHLNDIFDNKNLLSWSSRKKRNFFEDDVNHQSIPLSSKEVQVVERILLVSPVIEAWAQVF